MKKILCFTYLAILLASCADDDGDDSAVAPEKRSEVSSKYELGVCSEKNSSESILVTKENATYFCNGEDWMLQEEIHSSSSLDSFERYPNYEISTKYELGSCNEQNAFDSVLVLNENAVYFCNGIEWHKLSKVEVCSQGLSAYCLKGTWEMTGLVDLQANPHIIRPAFDYTAYPGKLVFNSDGTLEFTFPIQAPAEFTNDIDCAPLKASWSVEAGALTVKNVTQNFDNFQMCVLENIFTKRGWRRASAIKIYPELSTEGSVVKLVIPLLLMMGGESQATEDMDFFLTTGELYSSK